MMSVIGTVPERGLSRFIYEIREGGRKQANVVFALLFREIRTRTKEDDYGILSIVAIAFEPAIYVMTMAAFFYVMRRQAVMGVPIFIFVAVSLTAYSVIRRSLASVPRTMRAARAFYAYPNVKPIDAVLARFILEIALTILGGVMVLLFAWWFLGETISDQMIFHALGIFMMLIAAGFGISLFLAVYGMRFPFIVKLMAPFTRVLFFTSAVIHPASELPQGAQWFIAFNPFAHAMELLRLYALRMPCFREVSFSYFAGFCMFSLFLGLIAYYANRTKVLEL